MRMCDAGITPDTCRSCTPRAADAFALAADQVHVWYVFSDGVTDAGLLQRYAAMMSPDERARHERFMFVKDRHQFLVTRGVLRTLLARYTGAEPRACAFASNAYGRPALMGGATVDFNVSHTRGLVACAIARVPEVGVDVEDIERGAFSRDIARRYFSAAEADALDAVPEAARVSRFFDYWTLKEAYIKARGMGLSLPLDGFSMHPAAGGPPRIRFTATIEDDPQSWQFEQFEPSARHRLAVAVRRRGADLAMRFRELEVEALFELCASG
jgi:4'-phosphopantetheinyl transferase